MWGNWNGLLVAWVVDCVCWLWLGVAIGGSVFGILGVLYSNEILDLIGLIIGVSITCSMLYLVDKIVHWNDNDRHDMVITMTGKGQNWCNGELKNCFIQCEEFKRDIEVDTTTYHELENWFENENKKYHVYIVGDIHNPRAKLKITRMWLFKAER